MKIAILTSSSQWFIPYAKILHSKISNSTLLYSHEDIKTNFDIVFILNYHKIIPVNILNKNRHNIVVHASDLPKGKGWAPLFWQILENKNTIPFTMFEASSGVDDGDIYMQKDLHLSGYELNSELREKQAMHTIQMCLEFLNNYNKYKIPTKQNGKETLYKKRTPKDSKLDVNKTIKEQFNLLRIVDNENYPAFFEIDGHRYILKIELPKWGREVKLIDFTDMCLQEKKMVLAWRNDESIKKWMYNKNDISLQNHLNFIDSLESTKENQYILLKKGDIYIGVIDFKNIDFKNKTTDFGLYANPFEKVLGVGRVLEEICIKYAFEMLKLEVLKLEVFDENTKAKNLYEKFNFHITGKKVVNEKEVLCMELENREFNQEVKLD